MYSLDDILNRLKTHEDALKNRGVLHAAVFGSSARGEAKADSDIDIVIDLDQSRALNVFDYAAIKDEVRAIIGPKADVVTREGLKKAILERVEEEAIDVF